MGVMKLLLQGVKLGVLLGLCGSLAWPGWCTPPRFDYDRAVVKTVESNGSSEIRYDLVFVADGYTQSQYRAFLEDVNQALQLLWGIEFYRDYRRWFNVHTVFVPAVQEISGIQYPFGSTAAGDAIQTLHLTHLDELKKVTGRLPGCDTVVVMSTYPGTSTGGEPIILAGRDYGALGHELGHNLGKLGDEYSSRTRTADLDRRLPQGRDFEQVNLTQAAYFDNSSPARMAQTIKWKHFFSLPDGERVVGAYQGGFYRELDVYRPCYSCVMRSHRDSRFCPVCHEEMTRRLMKSCSQPFDDAAYHRKYPLRLWQSQMNY
ncbi:hypothetical protein JST97_03360 [bacterium]|nr:hypothetical protein [bacterium]